MYKFLSVLSTSFNCTEKLNNWQPLSLYLDDIRVVKLFEDSDFSWQAQIQVESIEGNDFHCKKRKGVDDAQQQQQLPATSSLVSFLIACITLEVAPL